MRHANRHYKAAYVRAFTKRVLRCAGPVGEGACPHAYKVDSAAPDAPAPTPAYDHRGVSDYSRQHPGAIPHRLEHSNRPQGAQTALRKKDSIYKKK